MLTYPYTKAGAANPNSVYYGFSPTAPTNWAGISFGNTLTVKPATEILIPWQDTFGTGILFKYMWIVLPRQNPGFFEYDEWIDQALYGLSSWSDMAGQWTVSSILSSDNIPYTLYVSVDPLRATNYYFKNTDTD